MTLLRPRLTDHFGIFAAQAELDFAIPILDEDIPLYVDPFLLWKSPAQQDQALHTSLVNSFNYQSWLLKKGRNEEAIRNLVLASECDEVGLGVSKTRQGVRIGKGTADLVLDLFRRVPEYSRSGFTHFEEIQLYVDGISKDRISDFACNFLKSFLVDYTYDQCSKTGIPVQRVKIATLHDYKSQTFKQDVEVELPVHPTTLKPLLLVPKRWLRFVPWINFDNYFAAHCPKDDVINQQGADERVHVLNYNRDHYGVVAEYVRTRERACGDCTNDPLFSQIPVTSAKRKLSEILSLPTGKDGNADKRYEDAASQLLASLMYPHLDFATTQSRSDGGSTIRDLVFYNNRSMDFLDEIFTRYGSRQLTMELKNVAAIERDHISQLNRYLTSELGSFGVIVTRKPLSRAMFKNTIELWSGQRRCIIAITDEDLRQMVEIFESKQRLPIEVLKKQFIDFHRKCPS